MSRSRSTKRSSVKKSVNVEKEGDLVEIPKKLVLLSFDDWDDFAFCVHDSYNDKLIKLPQHNSRLIDLIKSPKKALELFLHTDLPFITYHDVNVFDFYDDERTESELRYYKYSDSILERDVEIPNNLGLKKRTQHNGMESPLEHHYLPGMPNLIYEDYPFFQPHVEESHELSNDEFHKLHIAPFEKMLNKKLKITKKNEKEIKAFTDYVKNLDLYQTPVDHADYFTFSGYDFKDIFVDKVFGYIVDIYAALVYKDKKVLKEFLSFGDDDDDEGDDDGNGYTPEIRKDCFTSLKPIGSCAESPYAWGIFDKDTLLLNKLWVHVEFVNMSSGIGEGYELVFGTRKQNFQEGNKLAGADFTKRNNFLKRFTKCVSICLNSKTKRFIMTDYYWIGCFEIEDVFDGEIEDAKKFISKVKVKHFSYYNFEKDAELITIRNVIASFFFTTPQKSQVDSQELEKINNRVINEWKSFQKSESPLLMMHGDTHSSKHRHKRMKLSPFIYRTHTGLSFTRQTVDLERCLVKFIAIGTNWSCQTLLVNVKKLYDESSYLSKMKYKGPKEVLLSIYDEYYQDPSLSMVSRHLKNNAMKSGSTQLVTNAQEVFNNWLLNVEAYLRLKPLQGDLLAKMIDYGYLEDKKYNDHETHFKCDGYYILYERICPKNEDLEPVDTFNERHYQLAKEALDKIHQHGVTFAPKTSITEEVLKVYNDKVYVINLEAVNSNGVTPGYVKKDHLLLDRIFHKAEASLSSQQKQNELLNKKYFGLAVDEFSEDEDGDEDGEDYGDDDGSEDFSEQLY